MEIVLKTQNLSKFFGGLKALDNVNVSIQKNKITLIVGPNGSGKTTLINTVSGFYKADSGKVFFDGKDITNKPPHEISKLGITRTFQIPQPLKKLTVLENLLVFYNYGTELIEAVNGKWKKKESDATEKAFKILEFLKLDHLWDVQAQNLSGGQLKLLEIGRALMRESKLFIADEPVAGVNPVLAHEILSRFLKLKDEMSFLLVEHRLDIVLKYTDYIYVMANGKIIAEGREEVFEDPKVVEVYLSAKG
ncbi:MAG: ABC transporter ATP-binding protein [Archaeoglobaceae archaeon]|nr:ABC transporter ATP-binding protein [Archaeoglobaceae archaeon]MCX8151573.1 ABC transporter ATP-binding protein [Archaeoglobaceae archaeon]MDW8013149.1 ABC transporter ATP-binding protein [Archaeoglobaceae archaeon]